MNLPPRASPTVSPSPSARPIPPAYRHFWLATAALLLVFAVPLLALARLSLANDLYSHVLLIPVITGYLVWIKRSELQPRRPAGRQLAWGLFGAGAVVLGAYGLAVFLGSDFLPQDDLACLVLGLVLLFGGVCAWFFDAATLRALTFPLVFLIFLAPFPSFLQHGLETFLQHTSASTAYHMIKATGTPILREGLVFHLPGISLEVAPQCSGIRSTVALFITSLLAGYFFLRSPWKRTILTLFVVPLAIVRNGFRIFTIAELCVRVSPDMIHSYIHRQGGPIFFALSLIPFFFLLRFFYKSEQRPALHASPTASSHS